MKILIVDDDISSCKIVNLFLLHAGHQVYTAGNGKIGVERGIELLPDLILMDMQMPVMDGFDATRLLRQEGYIKPIIAFTTSIVEQSQILAAGCNFIIEKPFDPDKFLETVKKFEGEISQEAAVTQ